MDTYLKLTSVKNNKSCNCISPFYINGITGINPNTGRDYSKEDLDIMKTALYRISAAKGCTISTCCDPNDPTAMPDEAFTKEFKRKYPKIMPVYEGSQLLKIKLSSNKNVKESGWIDPTPYFICKITKATIQNTDNPNVQVAVNLVNDCFNDSCSSMEMITVNNLLQNSKTDMTYTAFDDARVSQAILEGNISYAKEYIRKYKQVDIPLTNNDYRNRMIHLAAESSRGDILSMLIALKANLNIQNKLGETPIHFAVRAKNLDNIATLLAQGVDLTIPTSKGETPMFYAMSTGDMRVVNMLYTNNSPILGVDKQGNNLIHYCILNCPSYKEDDQTVPNTKGEVIQWLIEHGISTEQKNNAGITPLELVSRQINKELDKECASGVEQDQQDVIEKFFGGGAITKDTKPTNGLKSIKKQIPTKHFNNQQRFIRGNPIPTKPKSNNKPIERFTNGNLDGASSQNLTDYTSEHLSLLDIQTKLFNNIIRNNPNKYGGYINVDDIPKGAPIEILDTVCVGGVGITGNEDSDECIAKGGQLTKIKNKTTKIKLELLPEEETATDAVDQKDLYYKKDPTKIPKGTVPFIVSNYNNSVKIFGERGLLNDDETYPTKTNQVPTATAGITYPIATGSTNFLEKTESLLGLSSPTTTVATTTIPQTTIPTTTVATMQTVPAVEHASILDENDQIVSKCKRDAFSNSDKIIKNTIKNKETFAGAGYTMSTTNFGDYTWNQILMGILFIIGVIILVNLLL